MNEIKPILKDVDVKDDILKNMGQYLHTSYQVFRNSNWIVPKEDYQGAKDNINKLIELFPNGKTKIEAQLWLSHCELKLSNIFSLGLTILRIDLLLNENQINFIL